MKPIQTYFFVGLLVVLMTLVAARPWGKFNYAVGIETTSDSLRADTLSHAELDSLIIEQVAVAIPDVVGDSLAYTIKAREKKKAYLEEQSVLLQAENQKLDARVKQLQHSIQQKQQSLVSMSEIEKLLAKQNGKGKQDASHLPVSDLETELNQRTGEGKSSHP